MKLLLDTEWWNSVARQLREWLAVPTAQFREVPLTHEIVLAAYESPLPHQESCRPFSDGHSRHAWSNSSHDRCSCDFQSGALSSFLGTFCGHRPRNLLEALMLKILAVLVDILKKLPHDCGCRCLGPGGSLKTTVHFDRVWYRHRS
jgi:hypothetical protein